MPARIFWDVDGTLISYTPSHPIQKVSERILRPHAREVIEALESFGAENYIWSRAGQANACEVAHQLGLPQGRCFSKPEFKSPEDIRGVSVPPDLVVDDNNGESILIYPHILVPTYEGDEEDDVLIQILPKIREFMETKESSGILSEFKVKFRRKRRIPSRIRSKRRKYYRRHKSRLKRYKRKYKRTPKFKRLKRLRKRLVKRFRGKLRRYRMRVSV